MDSVRIMGKLMIKQVVTESYKEKMSAEIQLAIQKVEDELGIFDKDMQKTVTELTLKGHPQLDQYRRQFNAERDKIVMYKEQLLASVKEVADLPIGVVLDGGEGNFLQDVKVGDNFAGSTLCEIVVQDDIVIQINQK